MIPRRRETGQATVELLGAIPVMLLVGLVAFQLLAVGYSASLAGTAAEAGALATAAGGSAADGARDSVPGWSRAGMRVQVAGGKVHVAMRPPSPLRAVGRALEVSASAGLGDP